MDRVASRRAEKQEAEGEAALNLREPFASPASASQLYQDTAVWAQAMPGSSHQACSSLSRYGQHLGLALEEEQL